MDPERRFEDHIEKGLYERPHRLRSLESIDYVSQVEPFCVRLRSLSSLGVCIFDARSALRSQDG